MIRLKALEQEPCDNAVSRQDVLDLAKKGVLVSNGNYKSVCKAINELPSVNPIEPCKDAIDRAEAIKVASGYCHPANVAKELAKLPPVNPQPCKDSISREWLKNAIHNFYHGLKHTPAEEDIQAYIDAAPPVNPTKTGQWIQENSVLICSICDARVARYDKYSYCPNCGARMIEPQESEE